MGWFYGFKLRLIINDQGGLISVKGTVRLTLMIESLYRK
ncbi:hypothetical protein BTN49_0412 [Candidatus Enterovibrio escicola]|uniref:Transposase DDE domain-containing protein n=1 Tax=Candidatus Enterovibrio escicola TaxID=1927127 RepID=A0A2A5T5K7_9GAMM|nr:transposase [Candidatus Enterovibrio escacola]PCS23444.1 hypothetical protein BTN49_0412 [Candidatus Enterovibrio escacola]